MIKLFNITLLAALCFAIPKIISAQAIHRMNIGDDMKNVSLTGLDHYPQKDVRIGELKGKFILLDFWSTGCTSCVSSFPKMEGLQTQFKKDLQIILVNPFQDSTKMATSIATSKQWIFKGFKMPNLPSTVGDSSWLVRFPTRTVPHHIWIDRNGKVMAITNMHNANAENIQALIAGAPVKMTYKSPFVYDLRKIKLANACPGHAQKISLYTHIGPYYDGEGGHVYGNMLDPFVDSTVHTIRIGMINVDIPGIIQEIFAIKQGRPPYDRVSDAFIYWNLCTPQWFQEPEYGARYDDWSRRTKLCFEIEVPLSKKDQLADLALKDLNIYLKKQFGVEASFPKRRIHCKALKVADKSKIPFSSGKKAYGTNDKGAITTYLYKNFEFPFISNDIINSFGANGRSELESNPHRPIAVVDETGLKDIVDMTLPYAYGKPDPQYEEHLTQALAGYGLSLVDAVQDVQVIQISETTD
ncbi:Thiol-disulfide isomerase or thioredoxin [bacterium A37T11]|nr:Thiol-disulfide isomerase or thioredoxin [bacterium A37T11]